MSRETAPHYRLHECCYYCGHSMLGRKDGAYCKKHDFFFSSTGEALARVCNDYGNWKILGVPDEFYEETKIQNDKEAEGEDPQMA